MSDIFLHLFESAQLFREFTELDYLGCFASACVLLTFCMQSMVRLRVVALASNIAFIAYAWASRLLPILVLHCILLAINSTSLARGCLRHRSFSRLGQHRDAGERPKFGKHARRRLDPLQPQRDSCSVQAVFFF